MDRRTKAFVICTFLCVASFQSYVHCAAGSWDYSGENGPDNWHTISANCGGSQQSPIDINTRRLTRDDTLGNFVLHNFGSSNGLASAYLKNTGHTVQMDLPGSDYYVEGGGFGRTYKVVQFHFHWGSTDNSGSEHTVNQISYPMEVHFVAYAVKYGDIITALNHNDGLAVLGFFFQIGDTDNPNWAHIVNHIDSVRYADTNVTLSTNFSLSSLLPTNTALYYRYQGSLTTPTCNEVVTWTVFKEPITISASQMAKFRSVMKNTEGQTNHTLSGNYRPVQPLVNRIVYTSCGPALSPLPKYTEPYQRYRVVPVHPWYMYMPHPAPFAGAHVGFRPFNWPELGPGYTRATGTVRFPHWPYSLK